MGYLGLAAFVLAWVSQSWDAIKAGRCTVNTGFLLLSVLGNSALTVYAVVKNDPVFFWLNALATTGALINLYFKYFPRKS